MANSSLDPQRMNGGPSIAILQGKTNVRAFIILLIRNKMFINRDMKHVGLPYHLGLFTIINY